ncbi:hypothetical protein FACS1894122_06110 [Alphaproteobacteria bacterium]|nr:hypothetical protein FACS1894122_06110 [Alphaproteobacteria bacterium]
MVLRLRDHPSFSREEVKNVDMASSVTPQYIIVCKDFFMSEISGEAPTRGDQNDYSKNSTTCLSFDVGTSRLITNDSSGQMNGDGRIVFDDPIVCMRYGTWAPKIQTALYEGTMIPYIGIRRFSSINGLKQVIQSLDYETCYIKTYRQQDDTIQFTFNSTVIQDVTTMFNLLGENKGNVGARFAIRTVSSVGGIKDIK